MSDLNKVPIVTRGDRGFHGYGGSVVCTYGTTVMVYESSSALGPHVWLNVKVDPLRLTDQPAGEGAAHLNEEQARALVARLQTWIDEIPKRWPDVQRLKLAREILEVAAGAESLSDPSEWERALNAIVRILAQAQGKTPVKALQANSEEKA